MRLIVEYFANEFYTAENALDQAPRFGQLVDGVDDATAIVGNETFAGAFTNQIDTENDQHQLLGISKSPTVVFLDADRGAALGKLEGSQITRSRVKQMWLFLAGLEFEPGTEDYITEDGKPMDEIQLFEASAGLIPGSFGGLIGGCPSWMPSVVCGWNSRKVLLIAVAVIALLIILKRK